MDSNDGRCCLPASFQTNVHAVEKLAAFCLNDRAALDMPGSTAALAGHPGDMLARGRSDLLLEAGDALGRWHSDFYRFAIGALG